MALTATATPAVQDDVVRQLGLRDPVLVRGSFDRPNLSLDVVTVSGAGATARKWAALAGGLADPAARPAIVYCGTRKATEQVAAGLVERGIRAAWYHAGLDPERRARAQEQFMRDEAEVMAATNAFGMGVDKATIRSVWHWAVPESLEQLAQEAGRAGRDGVQARAVLLYSAGDLNMIRQRIVNDRIGVADVEALIGRLARLADGEGGFRLGRESLPDRDRAALALAERAGAVELLPGRGGLEGALVGPTLGGERAGILATQVRAEERRRWRAHDAIRDYAEGDRCRRQRMLAHFGDPGPGAPIGRCCDVCDPLPPLREPAPSSRRGARAAPAADPDGPLSAGEEAVFQALRAWRAERTRADGVPAYRAGSDATLRAIARSRPAAPGELEAVRGVGPWFAEHYGAEVLALLALLGSD
jgi:ATP-dependent DNA helicase RecQ